MSLKSILVYIDDSERSAATVAAACALARKHEAHLTGLAVERKPQISGFTAIEIPSSVREIIEARNAEQTAELRQTFEAIVARAGWTEHSEWALARGPRLESLTLRSRYADLTVLAQDLPNGHGPAHDELVDEFALASGRPVLVIPYIGAPDTIGNSVVVGWNASREAARAVSDAMPILERAERVEVLAVDQPGIGDAPGADIAAHLARHGINVQARASNGADIDIGDSLLNRVSDFGADLLIIGAYGHSRMRELVLGGVTRHILQHMTVPVLLSH